MILFVGAFFIGFALGFQGWLAGRPAAEQEHHFEANIFLFLLGLAGMVLGALWKV